MLLYSPHSNQVKIHQSTAKYRVCCAGRRFGKTALALNEAIYRALQVKNQIIWIVLPFLKQAKEVYWIDPDVTKYFMPMVQNKYITKNDSDLSLHVKSTNSWIRMKGADNYEGFRGSGIDLLIWDEVQDTKPQAFDVIKPALADSPNHRQLFIGTPKGLNHFHDMALYGNHDNIVRSFDKPIRTNPDWMTFHYTSYDNTTWSEGSFERKAFVSFIDKERQDAVEKGKLSFFNQEYMASFEESGGRFFPRWSVATHGIDKPIDLSDQKYIIGSFDWGRGNAPVAWYANAIIPMTHNNIKFNRIITFKEVYGNDVESPYDWAKIINAKINYKKVQKTYCDPSMNIKLHDGSISIMDQFRKAFKDLNSDQPVIIPAVNKRPSRWAALDNWMRIAPDGLPYWMISAIDCPNLVRTIPLMVHDPDKLTDIDTTLEDHAIDSVSYAIQYIKWINAFMGGIRKYVPNTQMKKVAAAIDSDKFESVNFYKKDRDWRSI